jgi:hypothetical protein
LAESRVADVEVFLGEAVGGLDVQIRVLLAHLRHALIFMGPVIGHLAELTDETQPAAVHRRLGKSRIAATRIPFLVVNRMRCGERHAFWSFSTRRMPLEVFTRATTGIGF